MKKTSIKNMKQEDCFAFSMSGMNNRQAPVPQASVPQAPALKRQKPSAATGQWLHRLSEAAVKLEQSS